MGSGVEVPVPSLRWRAFVVLVLLVGFYVCTFALSAVLFAAPIAYIYFGGFHGLVTVLSFFACWAPAFVILMAALGARPPRFSPEGIELFPSQNPALYALVEEVAEKAGTAPPKQIYLMGMPMAGVVEVGGLFTSKSRRVLLLGAPLLSGITVEQLRAILAHEMGHFIGGETRLTGIISYAQHTFAAVYEAASLERRVRGGGMYGGIASEMTHAIGTGYVKLYMRLFLALTQPTSRKQEIAADALSVRLSGKKVAIGALERAHFIDPLYRAYLDNEVSAALAAGAAPIDLLDGFDVFCAKIAERGLESKLGTIVREGKTDPFDSHPAYSDRVAMMETFAESSPADVPNASRAAISLVEVEAEKLRSWLVDLLLDMTVAGRALSRLSWSEIVEKKLPAKIRKDAKELVEVLRQHFPKAKGTPAIFRATLRSLEDGSFVQLAHLLAPTIAHVASPNRIGVVQSLGAFILTPLFEATLLKRGATIVPSLGEPSLIFLFEGERIPAAELAAKAMSDSAAAAEVTRWADRLLTAPSARPAETAESA